MRNAQQHDLATVHEVHALRNVGCVVDLVVFPANLRVETKDYGLDEWLVAGLEECAVLDDVAVQDLHKARARNE